jgi:hypothetical protein
MIENNDVDDEDGNSRISSVSAYSNTSDDPFSLSSFSEIIGKMFWFSPVFAGLNIDEDQRDDIEDSIIQQPFNPISLEVVARYAFSPEDDNKKRRQQQKTYKTHDEHKQRLPLRSHAVHLYPYPTISTTSSSSIRLPTSKRISETSRGNSNIPVVTTNRNVSHRLLKLPCLTKSSRHRQKQQTLTKTKSKFFQ